MPLEFFAKLLSFFHGKKPEDGKYRLLKKLAKDIHSGPGAQFYKPKSMEIQPALGKILYDLYKTLAHAQVFLQNAAASEQLKRIAVEAFLDMKFLDARQRLNAEYFMERAQTMPIAEISRLLREDLAMFSSAFNAAFIARADRCYNQILSLAQLAAFDYFFFLRKFDPGITERNFTTAPHFKPVQGRLLLSQLEDFLEAAFPVAAAAEADWPVVLRILKTYKNNLDVVKEDEWAQALKKLQDLQRSSILELMIRHISQDPRHEFKIPVSSEHVAEAYLEECRQEVEVAFSEFFYSQKQSQINVLARELFGDPDIKRLQYYTEKDNEAFVQRGLRGFAYTQSLNYLKIFLIDFFQQDMQNLCELLLIRGHWASMEESRKMSEAFNILLNNINSLLDLEQSLGENGEEGARIRSVLIKTVRNHSLVRQLNSILQRINDEAWGLLTSTAEALVSLGKQFKEILVDAKKEGVYILNFRELQKESEPPLTQHLIISYKRIYAYLQIQQLVAGVDSVDDNASIDLLTV
jgi:hypothetical protein